MTEGIAGGGQRAGKAQGLSAAAIVSSLRAMLSTAPTGHSNAAEQRKASIISRLGRASPQRLIDVGRLVVSSMALVAIWADPTRPTVNVQLTFIVLAAYVVFALLVVLLLPKRRLNDPVHVISTAADIVFLGILAAITEELESPFFVFFTFVLISSAMRWGWPGVLTAALVLQALLVLVGIPDIDDADPAVNMLIMRSSYCWIATLLLGYFGSYRGRSEYRLRELAAWPHEIVPQEGWPWVATALQHAANVLGTDRIMVIWRDRDAPHAQLAWWSGSDCRFVDKVPAGISAALIRYAAAGECTASQLQVVRRAFPRRLGDVDRHMFANEAESIHASVLDSIRYDGCVMVVDPAFADEDTDSLTRIIAARISMELEHFALVCSFAAEAGARERAHLAHDLHDSVLQDLTAAVLQIDDAMRKLPPATHETLRSVGNLLRIQQSKIRQYVTESRTETGGRKYLRDQLQAFAAPLARQWNCSVGIAIEPAEIEVTEQLAMDLCLALSEATANAVRHGGARTVEVVVKAHEGRLLVEIRNDGELASEALPPTPWSLERRVSSLAGTLAVAERQGSLAVLIDLPLSTDVS